MCAAAVFKSTWSDPIPAVSASFSIFAFAMCPVVRRRAGPTHHQPVRYETEWRLWRGRALSIWIVSDGGAIVVRVPGSVSVDWVPIKHP